MSVTRNRILGLVIAAFVFALKSGNFGSRNFFVKASKAAS